MLYNIYMIDKFYMLYNIYNRYNFYNLNMLYNIIQTRKNFFFYIVEKKVKKVVDVYIRIWYIQYVPQINHFFLGKEKNI